VARSDLRQGARAGCTLFSAPFDTPALALLQGLEAPGYKIASFELVHLQLAWHHLIQD
jgi:N-acetylneuraminate synthase